MKEWDYRKTQTSAENFSSGYFSHFRLFLFSPKVSYSVFAKYPFLVLYLSLPFLATGRCIITRKVTIHTRYTQKHTRAHTATCELRPH